ncbi:hypothetical protein L1N85_14100 [Paenibacillus alkaliterrae]|uniref:hypothetical protein n=1 Tax=Paenibacillus alkaliterrae TaxID=320909 RepID=UPI001F345EE0|nr:hypothetical protein [Paenibacillus alkaliterrae]MCF2939552.1 hypothetical protein [Paenibacillus alkaliterrae]
MIKKRCLFCDEIVPIEPKGEHDSYISCNCSPGGFYSLLRDNYDAINGYSHQTKRQLFPLISAYIREQTDRDERVTLSIEDLDLIKNCPKIPVSIEDKGGRLLQYLYRHSEGPGEAVVIHPLTHSFNLTYSPNLQELVYIIEKLREEQLIIREGMTFKLTEIGWSEAAARAGGRKLKSCFVLLSDDRELSKQWSESVLPKLEQCGYLPSLFNQSGVENRDNQSLQLISESKLIIADLTNLSPEVYFAAGYALGMNVPVIWTVKHNDRDKLNVQTRLIRPFVWDTAEELAVLLQQRLSKS